MKCPFERHALRDGSIEQRAHAVHIAYAARFDEMALRVLVAPLRVTTWRDRVSKLGFIYDGSAIVEIRARSQIQKAPTVLRSNSFLRARIRIRRCSQRRPA
jgi:hypothetical protein